MLSLKAWSHPHLPQVLKHGHPKKSSSTQVSKHFNNCSSQLLQVISNMPPRILLERGGSSRVRGVNTPTCKMAHEESWKSSYQQHENTPNEKVESSAPSRHTNMDGRNHDKEIDQMREDICSLSETIRNYMAKNIRLQGSMHIIVIWPPYMVLDNT